LNAKTLGEAYLTGRSIKFWLRIFNSLFFCRNLSDNRLSGEIPEQLLQVAQYKYAKSAMQQTVEYVNYFKFI